MQQLLDGVERIIETLGQLNQKLDLLLQKTSEPSAGQAQEPEAPEAPGSLDVVALLNLPDKLRKTAMALARLGEASAERVSRETGRQRAVESALLNQLVQMGYVRKRRKSHTVLFYVPT